MAAEVRRSISVDAEVLAKLLDLVDTLRLESKSELRAHVSINSALRKLLKLDDEIKAPHSQSRKGVANSRRRPVPSG